MFFYDRLKGCLNPELGLKLWTEVQDCPMEAWGWMCGLIIACIWPGFGQSWEWIWNYPMLRLWHACVAYDGGMCGLLCGHLLCHNWL